MKWFKHFTSAHDNNSLTKVRMKYGADGYAIYWYCLELIASDLGHEENITFELKHDAEVIGFNLKIDTLRVEEIMVYMVNLGLFEGTSGVVTCLKLAKYLDKKNTRNKSIHAIIDAAATSEEELQRPLLSETVRDKSRRSPLDIDIDIDLDLEEPKDLVEEMFERFWNAGMRKANKKKAKLVFTKAWKTNKQPIVEFTDMLCKDVQQRLASGQMGFDKMHPTTYLNGERWTDEISLGGQSNGPSQQTTGNGESWPERQQRVAFEALQGLELGHED
jgi:hypothetical protein